MNLIPNKSAITQDQQAPRSSNYHRRQRTPTDYIDRLTFATKTLEALVLVSLVLHFHI